jgi:ELWxxDGT repeat protein
MPRPPPPTHLANFDGTLFFAADDGTHGDDLWESNGTTAGTVLVKDIIPGRSSSRPYYLTNVGGTLFLTVYFGETLG